MGREGLVRPKLWLLSERCRCDEGARCTMTDNLTIARQPGHLRWVDFSDVASFTALDAASIGDL